MASGVRSSVTLLMVWGALASAAACTSTAPGTPAGVDDASTTRTTPTASSQPDSAVPAAPREIDLDGLDPCRLWTPEQLTQLAQDPQPIGGGPFTRSTGDTACSFTSAEDNDPSVGFHLALVRDYDVSDLIVPDSHGVTMTVTDVAGFPAVREVKPAENLRPCKFAVRTAARQYVEVRLDYGSALSSGFLPIEQACDLTLKAATFAMQTLQTQR